MVKKQKEELTKVTPIKEVSSQDDLIGCLIGGRKIVQIKHFNGMHKVEDIEGTTYLLCDEELNSLKK